MTQYAIYVAAKQAIRRNPDLSDKEIALAIGIPDRVLEISDAPGSELSTIRSARTDVESELLAEELLK